MGAAVELESIPLCECCTIETAGEKKDTLLERGLETVSRFDGGLSRCRLDMLCEEREVRKKKASKARLRSLKGSRGASDQEQEEEGLLHGAARLCCHQVCLSKVDIV